MNNLRRRPHFDRLVIDVAVLDGKHEIRDGEADTDGDSEFGVVRTRTRLEGVEPVHVGSYVEVIDGKPYKYFKYTYVGRVTIEERTVRPEQL